MYLITPRKKISMFIVPLFYLSSSIKVDCFRISDQSTLKCDIFSLCSCTVNKILFKIYNNGTKILFKVNKFQENLNA